MTKTNCEHTNLKYLGCGAWPGNDEILPLALAYWYMCKSCGGETISDKLLHDPNQDKEARHD